MFIFAPFVCGGFVFCPYFAMQYLVSFLIVHSSRRGRESLLRRCYHVAVSVMCLFLAVPWVDLQCVAVACFSYLLTF